MHNLEHLTARAQKDPIRKNGLTICTDMGTPTSQFKAILDDYHSLLDGVIFSPGVVFLSKEESLKEKIRLCKEYRIIPYFDGLIFEIFFVRNQYAEYKKLHEYFELDHHIISNSCIEIKHADKCNIIKELSSTHVLSSVGSNNPAQIVPPYKWIELIRTELEAGSERVILHTNDSGTIGSYRTSGEVREGLIQEILTQIPKEKLIFGAPQKSQQTWCIELMGADCNLKIRTDDLVGLEAMRLGLDHRTFDLYLPKTENT